MNQVPKNFIMVPTSVRFCYHFLSENFLSYFIVCFCDKSLYIMRKECSWQKISSTNSINVFKFALKKKIIKKLAKNITLQTKNYQNWNGGEIIKFFCAQPNNVLSSKILIVSKSSGNWGKKSQQKKP